MSIFLGLLVIRITPNHSIFEHPVCVLTGRYRVMRVPHDIRYCKPECE